ncbi:putative glucose dehydrogenase [Aspergillus pseudoustus]|uniref:Glucose dehydrogenase n=1 Tax=Aspergillus pseudoustus TaxID=1810923 RepID=A0ABR4JXM1_9EURO
MASSTEADYIIVGGGLTGCVVSSRLKQANPALDVVILEAGVDPSNHEATKTFAGLFSLLGSDLDWAGQTVPQKNTADRVHPLHAGKALGGGSVTNFQGWSRGDARDYDQWAVMVDDSRWSYEGLLPYFKKSETFFDESADSKQHGFHGPLHVTAVSAGPYGRKYPLRDPIKDAWLEVGEKFNPDGCSGSLGGICEFYETWHKGQRQSANEVYKLHGVQRITEATVSNVEFTEDKVGREPTASGVVLADGRRFTARKEIILAAGTLRTPQVLLLSGIGPAETLKKFDIPTVLNAPAVGRNLTDHFALYQLYKLRNPERGLALGSSKLSDPIFMQGFPCDWAVNQAVPREILESALRKDEQAGHTTGDEALLAPGRPLVETLAVYAAAGVPNVPVDGSVIMTSVMLLGSTSRGTISISSASPTDPPVVDSNYFDTEVDKMTLIHGARRTMQALLETDALKDYVEAEITPPGIPTLSATSGDEEFEARIRATGLAHHHPTGTAAMGKVVDTDLRVLGVRNLRIVDASVLPISIGGHPQATLYAVAEQAAEIILQG